MAELRNSRQRESIKQYLYGRTDHPTAEQIYTDLRAENPKLSLGTVYRNLALLAQLGEIRKISTLIGPDHFDGNTSMHYHYICRCCQKMSDVMLTETSGLADKIKDQAAGSVEEIELVAYGTCHECKKQTVTEIY